MKANSPGNVFSCLLSVVLLIATTMPPAVAHIHSGSSDPHFLASVDHGHEHEHAHHFGHHVNSATHPHHHRSPAAESPDIAESDWHLHISFFGCEIILPAGSPPLRNSQDEGAEPYLVQVLDSDATVPFACSVTHWAKWALAPTQTFLLSPCPPLFLSPLSHTGRNESLLCDTARHERSGVQLI